MQHILNSRHTTSTVPWSNFTILRRNIGPIPVISVTIVTPVEVVVAVAVSNSDIMTLMVLVTIDLTLVLLDLGAYSPYLSLGHSVRNPPLLIC